MRKNGPKKNDFIDDGRVIANMNVEGMPGSVFRRRKAFDEFGMKAEKKEPVHLMRRERLAVFLGMMTSYLLYALAVFGALGLFIFFCIKIWFR